MRIAQRGLAEDLICELVDFSRAGEIRKKNMFKDKEYS